MLRPRISRRAQRAELTTPTRFRLPRGLLAGTAAGLLLVWLVYLLAPGSSRTTALVQSGVYVALLLLTVVNRRVKVLLVRTLQHYVLNPVMRLLLQIGINPLGLAVLETRGHRSGRMRRTPVGNGRTGTDFWIIAEHGWRAGYVCNIAHDPQVRVRLRIGLRYRWVPGVATILADDDPLARQRQLIAWHPLRALNAVNVRILGADLLTVHVHLHLDCGPPPAIGRAARRDEEIQLQRTGPDR